MAQIKISELTTLAQQLQSADYVPVVHNAVTYKYSPYNYFVKNSGNETIAGVKTFSSTPVMTIQGGSASAIIDTIIVRKDTAANWTSANPVLHQGEKGLETDTGKEKTGDGVTAWNSLAYSLAPLSSTPSAGKVMVWPSNLNTATMTINSGYFTGVAGEYYIKWIGEYLFIRFSMTFSSRTITVSDTPFLVTGLPTGYSKVARCSINVDTANVRTTVGADINITTNGSGVISLYPTGDRPTTGGTITGAGGLYCDATIRL